MSLLDPVQIQEEKETGRVESFSDGVFAVAITLLVFFIPVPHGEALLPFIGAQWPSFAVFAVSFLTILVMWVNHHSVFQNVVRIDRPFLMYNGLLLMCITFVNYPTVLLGTYLGKPDGHVAAAIYSGDLVLIAIFYNLVWNRAATGLRLLSRKANPEHIASISRQYWFGPLAYLLAFGLAFVNSYASIALNGALAIYYAFTGRIQRGNT
jgi:uncharacterized membrane protein